MNREHQHDFGREEGMDEYRENLRIQRENASKSENEISTGKAPASTTRDEIRQFIERLKKKASAKDDKKETPPQQPNMFN